MMRNIFLDPHKRFLAIIVFLILLAGIPLAVFIAQKRQDIRQRAGGSQSSFFFSFDTTCTNPITDVTLPLGATTIYLCLNTGAYSTIGFDATVNLSSLLPFATLETPTEGNNAVLFESLVENTFDATAGTFRFSKSTSIDVTGTNLVLANIPITANTQGTGSIGLQSGTVSTVDPSIPSGELTVDLPTLTYAITTSAPTATPESQANNNCIVENVCNPQISNFITENGSSPAQLTPIDYNQVVSALPNSLLLIKIPDARGQTSIILRKGNYATATSNPFFEVDYAHLSKDSLNREWLNNILQNNPYPVEVWLEEWNSSPDQFDFRFVSPLIYKGKIDTRTTPTATSIPTSTPIPTPTIVVCAPPALPTTIPTVTQFLITATLPDIHNPVVCQKQFTAQIFYGVGPLINTQVGSDIAGSLFYDPATQNYKGIVNGGSLASGQYFLKIKIQKYISHVIPGFQTVSTPEATLPITVTNLTIGDINNSGTSNNQVDIQDYNTILSCFGDKAGGSSCPNGNVADLDEDGIIGPIDLNIYLRSKATVRGD